MSNMHTPPKRERTGVCLPQAPLFKRTKRGVVGDAAPEIDLTEEFNKASAALLAGGKNTEEGCRLFSKTLAQYKKRVSRTLFEYTICARLRLSVDSLRLMNACIAADPEFRNAGLLEAAGDMSFSLEKMLTDGVWDKEDDEVVWPEIRAFVFAYSNDRFCIPEGELVDVVCKLRPFMSGARLICFVYMLKRSNLFEWEAQFPSFGPSYKRVRELYDIVDQQQQQEN